MHYLASKYLSLLLRNILEFCVSHDAPKKKRTNTHTKFYGRRRAAVASPRREGEPRNSVSRRAGRRPRGYWRDCPRERDSPNYVVLPRDGERRAPFAASHRTCMGAVLSFLGACETQNSKMFHNSTLKYLDAKYRRISST